ncbi:hypothetical protein HY627_00480 [Candidatus Uhrbacteria bacterium]|nr:hypothetical protein [Candidatus Uhrbacteria bacterium]
MPDKEPIFGEDIRLLENFPEQCALKKISLYPLQEGKKRLVNVEYKDERSYSLFIGEDGHVASIVQPKLDEEMSAKGWTSVTPANALVEYHDLLSQLHDDILDAELPDEEYGVLLAMKEAA